MISILTFLSKLKLSHLLIIVIVVLSLLTAYFWKQNNYHKKESQRNEQNFESLRDFKDTKIAELKFTNNADLEKYINSENDLRKIYEQQAEENNIKIKHLQNLVFQKQVYKDDTVRTANITTIIEYIKQNIPHTTPWADSTDCLTIKGQIVFKNDSLYNEVLSRKFENNMLLTGYLMRPQKNWFTRSFGKRYATSTVTSTCGETQTIVIDKKK